MEARWILQAATGKGPAELLSGGDLTDEEEEAALVMADRRMKGEPLQYVTGIAGFRHLELRVGPGVFIPRPETELVAERAMAVLPRGGTLIDIGTGSGAIALAVAQERPDAHVWATEASPEALHWARSNRDRLGLEIGLLQADLFEGLPEDLRGKVDVAVSNPPYISWSHRHRLPADVVEHEPHEALFASGEGRTVIGRLVADSLEWLVRGGRLVIEIGEDQGPQVEKLFTGMGFVEVQVEPDLTGRDRIVEGRRP